MDPSLSLLISPAATLAVAAAAYWAPGSRQRRQMRHAADTRLLGRGEVTDRSGDTLVEGVPSLAAQVDDIAAIVRNSPLLNGKGAQLAKDVQNLVGGFTAIRTEAAEAKRLAGEAAAKAETLSKDVRHVQRGVNAIRAELDTYAKVVSRDTAELWSAMQRSGVGRRQND